MTIDPSCESLPHSPEFSLLPGNLFPAFSSLSCIELCLVLPRRFCITPGKYLGSWPDRCGSVEWRSMGGTVASGDEVTGLANTCDWLIAPMYGLVVSTCDLETCFPSAVVGLVFVDSAGDFGVPF